jgi:hypothetical protein
MWLFSFQTSFCNIYLHNSPDLFPITTFLSKIGLWLFLFEIIFIIFPWRFLSIKVDHLYVLWDTLYNINIGSPPSMLERMKSNYNRIENVMLPTIVTILYLEMIFIRINWLLSKFWMFFSMFVKVLLIDQFECLWVLVLIWYQEQMSRQHILTASS